MEMRSLDGQKSNLNSAMASALIRSDLARKCLLCMLLAINAESQKIPAG
jgi:hypothetical protein